LELSSRAEKFLIRIGALLAVLLGGVTFAYAGNWALPHQWSAPGNSNYAGPNLRASDLDDNFAALADAGASLRNLQQLAAHRLLRLSGATKAWACSGGRAASAAALIGESRCLLAEVTPAAGRPEPSMRGAERRALARRAPRRRRAACYPDRMIKDPEAYARLCDREQWDALRAMRIDASIAVMETLLTSELMDIAVFADDDHPMSLARSLGISEERLRRAT
jgi:hypothetical protein